MSTFLTIRIFLSAYYKIIHVLCTHNIYSDIVNGVRICVLRKWMDSIRSEKYGLFFEDSATPSLLYHHSEKQSLLVCYCPELKALIFSCPISNSLHIFLLKIFDTIKVTFYIILEKSYSIITKISKVNQRRFEKTTHFFNFDKILQNSQSQDVSDHSSPY